MSFTRTAVIRAPPERIFSVLADLGQTKQWMPAVQSIDNVTPGPVRVGTAWKETRDAAATPPRDRRAGPPGPPQNRVPMGRAEGYVPVPPPADPGRDVVHPELQVLVDRGLEREGPDDPRRKVLLCRLHIPLRNREDFVQAGFPQRGGVVPHDHVFRDPLGLVERPLLLGG